MTIEPARVDDGQAEAQAAAALVAQLTSLGVRLRADGTQLRVDAPKGVMTEALMAQLVAHKAAVLAILTQPVTGVPARQQFPLSYAQERLWFLDRLQPGQPLYVMSWAYHLRGSLDVPALARALGDLVSRHAVLRTVYTMEEGVPSQQVQPAAPFALPVIDLAHLPAAARTAEVQRLAQAARDQPFDLAADPMLRAQLLRLAADEHALLLSIHHIAGDGWSMGVFWRELATLYAAHRIGDTVTLPPLPLQYGDYAVWQRGMMAAGAWDGQLAYWRQQLHDLSPLALPYDHSQPASVVPRGAARHLTVPIPLTAQLRALARAEGVTLTMLLLAAFQVLLADICGQDDIGVGMPVAGRRRVDLEGLIGFFANTLVVRSDLAGSPTFRQFLHQVRQTVLAALENQDIPFSHLVADLRPARQMTQNPLFQVLFQLNGFEDSGPELADVTVERLPAAGSHARFDLELLLRAAGETLTGRLVYNADRFADGTIEQIINRYTGLLQAIVADPDRRVGVAVRPHVTPPPPASLGDTAGPDSGQARTDIEAALRDLWCEVLGLPQAGIHDDFFALGGHSLAAIRLCAAVEQRLGVQLPVASLFRAPTIAQLAAELAAEQPDEDWSSVVPIQARGSRPPFFCVHGFAGGVGGYAALAYALGPEQPFYGLQAAGVDGRLPPDGTIEAMAARYLAAMRRVQPVGPYRIGGYCFGGVVAFEMARQLRAQGEPPALVAIIEGVAPRRFQRRLAPYDLRRWQTLWRSLPFWLDEYQALGWARVQRRVQAKIRRQWKNLLRRGGHAVTLAPQDMIDADLRAVPGHLRELMGVHLRALRQYHPQPGDVRVTLFRAQLQTVNRALFGALDPESGWGALALGGVDVHEIAAGHRTIHLPPHVDALANALRARLVEARESRKT